MTIHLSLLDDARPSLVEALRAYQGQVATEAAARDPRRIAQAITQLHIGLEKGFKHRLGQIDQALPVARLSGGDLQKLRKLQLEQGAPTLLSVRTRVDTHGLSGLLHILTDILSPSLVPGILDQFIQHCVDLVALRNQHVHAELFGSSDEILAVITRLLSRLRPVLQAIHPQLLAALREDYNQLDAYLTGIENDVDGAWHVLTEYVTAQGAIDIEVTCFVTLPSDGGATQFSLAGAGLIGNSLSARALLPPGGAKGLFARPLAPGDARFWDLSQKQALIRPQEGLLALFAQPVPEIGNLGARGFIPTEDGMVSLVGLSSRVFVSVPGEKPSFIAANARIDSSDVTFIANQEGGSIVGRLSSGAVLGGAAKAASLAFQGTLFLDAEFVYTQAVEHAPLGSTVRSLKGTLTLRGIPATATSATAAQPGHEPTGAAAESEQS
ncbi:MAG: hypothetical protein JNJ80_13155 [Gemmatimonadetes bacterium]|nr:hypothetical protein [Gemmatimonadota bacterium]